MHFSSESTALSVENESRGVLLRYGLPTVAATIALAYLGNDLMQVAVLAGALVAYVIVRRRRVYPFGRLAGPAAGVPSGNKELASLSARLESHKDSLRIVAMVWFMLLAAVSAFSVLVPLVYVNSVAGTDLIGHITGISIPFSQALSYVGEKYRETAMQYFVMMLRAVDHAILLSLSLFCSITGSACLYWLFIHRKHSSSIPKTVT